MARARLTGSLLAGRAIPPARNSVQPVGTLWLDPSAIGLSALQAPRPGGRAPKPRGMVALASAAALAGLAAGGIASFLFLAPSQPKPSPETALATVEPAANGKLMGRAVQEPQPSSAAATVLTTPRTVELPAANAGLVPTKAVDTFPVHPAGGVAGVMPAVASEALPLASKASAGAMLAVSTSANTATHAPPGSAAANAALIARGDALFVAGDITSARLFYERAADAGDGWAALRLGETYDPDFLARTRIPGNRANAAMAAHWYRRAGALGMAEADILLKAAPETKHPSR